MKGVTMAFTYYFNVSSICLIPGFDTCMVNEYAYHGFAPKEEDGQLWFSLDDFRTIYAKVYAFAMESETVSVSDGKRTIQVPVFWKGTPVIDLRLILLSLGYHELTKDSPEFNHLILFTKEENVTVFPREMMFRMDTLKRGKPNGDQYELFWFADGEKLVPYRIYLPTDYSRGRKYPVVFYLHGGNGGPGQGFEKSHNDLQYYAEKEGFAVVGVDGFIKDATYGYKLFPNPGDPRTDYDCPENPAHYSDEFLKGIHLGELCLEETIKVIQQRYAVDPDHMFLMGNSMGGEGTFYFAGTHPGMFKAISPAGAMVNTKLTDLSGLKDTPILFVGGTEDFHGFSYLQEGVEFMESIGLDIHHVYIGGGSHGDAWAKAIPETFAFFKKYCQ